MATKIDMRRVESFPPVGTYLVEVDRASLRENYNRTAVYVNLEVQICEGDHAGELLRVIRSLSPRALWSLKLDLTALGVDCSGEVYFDWADEEEIPRTTQRQINERPGEWALVAPALHGRRAMASVTHKEWNGKTQAKVKRLVKID